MHFSQDVLVIHVSYPLTLMSELVSTEVLIPLVLLTGFLWSLTTSIRTCRSDQWASGATWRRERGKQRKKERKKSKNNQEPACASGPIYCLKTTQDVALESRDSGDQEQPGGEREGERETKIQQNLLWYGRQKDKYHIGDNYGGS